jgi:hypothetical protein
VTYVVKLNQYGRVVEPGDYGIANIAGVATKAKIKIHRNQQTLLSPVFLLKEQRKMLSTAS